jgi:hypothetical protein
MARHAPTEQAERRESTVVFLRSPLVADRPGTRLTRHPARAYGGRTVTFNFGSCLRRELG